MGSPVLVDPCLRQQHTGLLNETESQAQGKVQTLED